MSRLQEADALMRVAAVPTLEGRRSQLRRAQRGLGNAATHRLLLSGPGASTDTLETKADVVRDAVLAGRPVGGPCTLRRLRALEDSSPRPGALGTGYAQQVVSPPGRGLDAARSRLEAETGADLAGLRIHTDGEAGASARRLRASGYTVDDIVFAPGAYQPDTSAGLGLLGHEVGRIVQRDGGPRVVQRQHERAEATQTDSGPCEVDATSARRRRPAEAVQPGAALPARHEAGPG
jgi:hypothetical protein